MFTTPAGLLRKKGLVPPDFIAQASTIIGGGNNSIIINKPTGTQQGDLMVMLYWGEGNNTQIISGPAGWTNDITNSPSLDGSTHYMHLWHKIAGAGEASSYTWDLSGSSGVKGGVILTYRPVSTSQYDTSDFTNTVATNSATHLQSALTTVHNQAKIVYAWGLDRTGGSSVSVASIPGSMAQRFSSTYSVEGRPDLALVVCDETIATAGGTGSKTLTTNESDVNSSGIRVAIRAQGT